MQAVSFQKFK